MKVTEICVNPEARRMRLTVEMPDPDRILTSQAPHLPQTLFRLFPHLAKHKCDNGQGYTFRRKCCKTEIPHLFEHLIIELQAQAQPVEVLRGETQWNWRIDPRSRFYVFVDYENELLAVGAIRLSGSSPCWTGAIWRPSTRRRNLLGFASWPASAAS